MKIYKSFFYLTLVILINCILNLSVYGVNQEISLKNLDTLKKGIKLTDFKLHFNADYKIETANLYFVKNWGDSINPREYYDDQTISIKYRSSSNFNWNLYGGMQYIPPVSGLIPSNFFFQPRNYFVINYKFLQGLLDSPSINGDISKLNNISMFIVGYDKDDNVVDWTAPIALNFFKKDTLAFYFKNIYSGKKYYLLKEDIYPRNLYKLQLLDSFWIQGYFQGLVDKVIVSILSKDKSTQYGSFEILRNWNTSSSKGESGIFSDGVFVDKHNFISIIENYKNENPNIDFEEFTIIAQAYDIHSNLLQSAEKVKQVSLNTYVSLYKNYYSDISGNLSLEGHLSDTVDKLIIKFLNKELGYISSKSFEINSSNITHYTHNWRYVLSRADVNAIIDEYFANYPDLKTIDLDVSIDAFDSENTLLSTFTWNIVGEH